MLPPGVYIENNKVVIPYSWKLIRVYDKTMDYEYSVYYVHDDINDTKKQILYPEDWYKYPLDVITDEHIIWFLEYAMTFSHNINLCNMIHLAFERALDGYVHANVAKNNLSLITIQKMLSRPDIHLYKLIMNGWSIPEVMVGYKDDTRVYEQKIKQERHLRIKETKEILSTVIVPDLANIVLLYHIL
jgi:hypothetical protein